PTSIAQIRRTAPGCRRCPYTTRFRSLLAWTDGDKKPMVALYAVQGGFFADVSSRMPLPLPAGAVFATFADYDNDIRELTSAKKPDRKSTRLNSSHVSISYAVCVLKNK